MLSDSEPDVKRLPPEGHEPRGIAADAEVGDPGLILEQQLDSLERQMGNLQRQVQQLQRLAALGTVSAILAHEFNNILTPMLTYSQYALSQDDPAFLRTAVEKNHKHAKRLATLCGKILGMATNDQMGPIDTEIKPLLTDAVECVGRALDKDNIQITLDAPADLKARVHGGALQQVLFNLVLNARQAMLDQPGRLTLVALATEDGRVRITVSDTGCGIKPENLEKIFESFYTTKGHEDPLDRRGIGLGLYVSRQLIEEQDGEIAVESEPGRGTTFTITLPGTV